MLHRRQFMKVSSGTVAVKAIAWTLLALVLLRECSR